jgi:hypothetical protein
VFGCVFHGPSRFLCPGVGLPRMLRMPSLEQLPPGTRREFAAELFWHYRKAGRPELPRVVNALAALPEAPSVSRETVRRLLKGEAISRWDKVDALLRAMCSMGDREPDDQRWPDDYDDDSTYRDRLRQLWDNDIDGVQPEPESPPAQNSTGGWGRHRASNRGRAVGRSRSRRPPPTIRGQPLRRYARPPAHPTGGTRKNRRSDLAHLRAGPSPVSATTCCG